MNAGDANGLEGRVAVVTGSTRGIGRSIAEGLLERGARVVVSSRTAERVTETEATLSADHPDRVLGRVCDVRKAEDCQALVEATVEHFGGIDVLVNNAGLGKFAPIQEMDPEDWDIQIRTNLGGVFHCSKAAVPHLIERGGGWIFNIGSLAGRYTFSGGVAYNASKFGLVGMTEAMMLDLRHQGIRVSIIMPGSVNTHFFEGGPDPADDWKLRGEDIARVVTDLMAFPERAHPSRIEIRPSQPPKKD